MPNVSLIEGGVINYLEEYPLVLINFTLTSKHGQRYDGTCEEGMTFSEFIDSSYNTCEILSCDEYAVYFDDFMSGSVRAWTIIEDGKTYSFTQPT